MYPEEGGHMERKIVLIIIFSILIISNVFCIATIIRINNGLTQLDKEKEKIEVRLDSLIKSGEEITKEINWQRERGPEFAREIEKRLGTLERHENNRARSGGPERIRKIEEKLDELKRQVADRAGRGTENVRNIAEGLGNLKQRMEFRTREEKQIEKRLNGLERHGGDQARICAEENREMEKKFRRFEEKVGEEVRKLLNK